MPANRPIRSDLPEVEVGGSTLHGFAPRHAARLGDKPAMVDGATGRTISHGRQPPADTPYRAWGTLAAIDLHGCDLDALADPTCIRTFVSAMIEAIGMRAHGPLALQRFGTGGLEGWSAMQFIETSSITVHTDEVCDRCFVDVFSCRPFDSGAAAAVAVAHFGGTFTLRVLHR